MKGEKWWGRFSLARSIFWAALIVPSFYFGWIYAVAFVSIASLYANAASDYAAYRADRNKAMMLRLQSIEDKLDQLLKEDDKVNN